MPVSTKTPVKSSVPAEGNFIKSMLEPGNYKVRILNIYLQPNKNPEFGDKLILKLETEPIGGKFKGLAVDKNDPSKGNYDGRVGFVAYDKFPYKDWVSPTGDYSVEKEIELQVAIQDLCIGLGITKWYEDQDEKAHPDMKAFIAAFDEDRPFKDIYFHACIAGKEYIAQGKYTNYEMWFPKVMRDLGLPYSLDENKVQKYFASLHLERLKDKTGETNNGTLPAGVGSAVTTEVKEGPVHSKPTSQAEIDFMNEGKNKTVESPFTAEAEETTNESNTDIITGNDGDKFPWEK